MNLIRLVFLAAILLESLGSYISVIGLSSKSSIILMVLTIALDFAKVVIASVLYKNWKSLNFLFKTFLVPTLCFLIVITSWGAYAYLLQEFSKTTSNQTQISAKIESLTNERTKLQARKLEIDKQIAEVPPEFISQKKRMNDLFSEELKYGNSRIIALDKEIPELTQDVMKDTTEAGTLGSLAKVWGTTPEQVAKFLAFLMVIVIDPLAIVLLMVGNFLQIKRVSDLANEELEKERKLLEQAKNRKRIELENEIMNEQLQDEKVKKEEVKKSTGKAYGITGNGAVVNQDGLVVKKPIENIEQKEVKEISIKKDEVIHKEIEVKKDEIKDETTHKEIEVKREDKKKVTNNSWETSKPIALDVSKAIGLDNKDDPFSHDGTDLGTLFKEYNDEDTPKVLK